MPDDPIIQALIARPGQSQTERLPGELGVHYADVDERTPEALLAYARELADTVPFIGPDNKPSNGGWTAFFTASQDLDRRTRPPLALFDAFLRLYDRGPRAAINRLTERQLEFFLQKVLGFAPRAATPDRAHVVLSLKKGSPSVLVGPTHVFTAGKDASGVEQLYTPTTDVVVNASEVASLGSVFLDEVDEGRVHFAPVANSADGLGTALPEDAPGWRPFGHAALPAADVGFAVASPVLRMKEGHRTLTLTLKVDGATGLDTPGLDGAFLAYLTGEKAWLGPYGVAASVSASGQLEFTIELPTDAPAVTGYDASIHAHRYTTDAPVLQLLLQPGAGVSYGELSRVRVRTARLTVDVSGVSSLTLESDAGSLDPKKAFLPFGPQAGAGSRFLVGCDEALSKSLSRLDLTLTWKGAPKTFPTLYSGYAAGFKVTNSAFTAAAVFRDRASEHTSTETLFDADDATRPFVVSLLSTAAPVESKSRGRYVYALSRSRLKWARQAARREVRRHPTTHSYQKQLPEARPGYVMFSLNRGFLHQEYRQQSVSRIIAKVNDPRVSLLNEPYAPTLQGLSLSYTAHTGEVAVSSTAADDFADLDVQFFLVGPFGQMRDHGHQRAALGLAGDTDVPLVPVYRHRGELLVGLSGLGAGDSVSVLFQVAEGSADPDVTPERPEWFVLCDNYWKPLGAEGVVRDTTNMLLASGVVTFVVPAEATTENTIMPDGLLWLKAVVTRAPEATCRMVDVVANAVELRWVMDSEAAAAAHLATALPAGSIKRMLTPLAQVAKVKQPYPSFGGRPREDASALRTRAAERLRHKSRAITAWDFERIVLEAFPSVHRVKCVPHARPGACMAPGHVLVVVVPDLRNRNAPDPLQPKIDAGTLVRITDRLGTRAGGQLTVHVKNPAYQRLRVACRVKFRTGYEFNFYRNETVQALVRVLSPWAFDETRSLGFGGRVYASTLLNFVEELPYVDYVTDFTLLTRVEGGDLVPVERAEPATPDAILVSDATHDISEAG